MSLRKFNASLIFLTSPLLSIPFCLVGVFYKSKYFAHLFIIAIGILSFLYIPNFTNDRTRYFEYYQDFSSYGIDHFLRFILVERPDFFLHFLILIFAKAGLSIQLLLLLITSFTVWVWYYIFLRLIDHNLISNLAYFVYFIIIIVSFSLPDLFSGIRFYFGASMSVLGLYLFFIERRYLYAVPLMFFAVLTHFSTIYILFVGIISIFFASYYKTVNTFFLFSFLFLLIPKDFLFQIFSNLAFNQSYLLKIQLYLDNQDFIEQGLENGSSNYIYVVVFSLAWLLFAYIYLLSSLSVRSGFRSCVLIYFGLTNLFFSVPNVFSRFMLVGKLLFVLLFIYENYKNFRFFKTFVFLSFLLLNLISSIIIMRNSIVLSYFNVDTLLSITIFLKTITLKDVIY